MAGCNLTVNGPRLWHSVQDSARFGATDKGGICRLALGEADRLVRDWFVAACEEAGCRVSIDDMGNIFASRPGRNPALPPIAIGSHLDTQPTGGRFDGVIGVLAGLEVLRSLNDLEIWTEAPVVVINWTNEEGSRFAPAMLASGVFAGVFDRSYADARPDADGVRFDDALEKIGYRGDAACGDVRLGAHFELHIEQGPLLEADGLPIGVVTGVQGMRWYEVSVRGQDSHAGTTPMAMRHDAMLAAARMIDAVERIARSHAGAVGTVGMIRALPNSRNVVAGEVRFSVDLRHPADAVLAAMQVALEQAFAAEAARTGVQAAVDPIWESPAVGFDAHCVAAVADAARDLGLAYREMVSGAGHDSAYVARVAPTAMVFVPCAGGLSHNELESAEPEHVTAGANVLLRAVLETDRRLYGGMPPG